MIRKLSFSRNYCYAYLHLIVSCNNESQNIIGKEFILNIRKKEAVSLDSFYKHNHFFLSWHPIKDCFLLTKLELLPILENTISARKIFYQEILMPDFKVLNEKIDDNFYKYSVSNEFSFSPDGQSLIWRFYSIEKVNMEKLNTHNDLDNINSLKESFSISNSKLLIRFFNKSIIIDQNPDCYVWINEYSLMYGIKDRIFVVDLIHNSTEIVQANIEANEIQLWRILKSESGKVLLIYNTDSGRIYRWLNLKTKVLDNVFLSLENSDYIVDFINENLLIRRYGKEFCFYELSQNKILRKLNIYDQREIVDNKGLIDESIIIYKNINTEGNYKISLFDKDSFSIKELFEFTLNEQLDVIHIKPIV